MQARNIVVLGSSSKRVRNYIMRGISFVVFIQKINQLDKKEILNSNTVYVDKSHLPENVKSNKNNLDNPQNLIWLWYLPFGTSEDDVIKFLGMF